MFVNYYSLLGVSPHAKKEEIVKAFRTKAKYTHPDVGGKHEDFLILKKAYDVLINENQRKFYNEQYWKHYQTNHSNAKDQKQKEHKNERNVNQDNSNQSDHSSASQDVSNIEENINSYRVQFTPKTNGSCLGVNWMKHFLHVGLFFIIIGTAFGILGGITTKPESEYTSSNLQPSTNKASDDNQTLIIQPRSNQVPSASQVADLQLSAEQNVLKPSESMLLDTTINQSKVADDSKINEFMYNYVFLSVEALNKNDFSIVEPHINPNGKKYDEQRKYIDYLRKKNIFERLLAFEARDIKQINESQLRVKTYEEYSIKYGDGTSKFKSFNSEYLVDVSENGSLLVNELLKTNEIESKTEKTKSASAEQLINPSVRPSLSHFTLESSKEEVLSIMGAPSSSHKTYQGETWSYGLAQVDFNEQGKVIEWADIGNKLKVSIGVAKPKVPPFTLGSPKKEVIEAMGTPNTLRNSFGGETWSYDLSSIEFNQQGQVIGWSEIGTKLYVSIGDENPEAAPFTMGSSLKDVINAMGTPTAFRMTFSGVTWGYGLSSVEFDRNGIVVGWSDIQGNLKTQ
ncbi:J domain-containing protein [Brevibacillus centrosporus]|uniref:J domain-containing protein n=1 Tax=Brevibacillus centrosporus TaxID=54910 RepID=UPI0014771910|nr:J domain-containing protein [Brevibacillus centrosporus]MEC2132252.1 J domain-containing protein [Brevibacillus centrosporus]